MSPHQGFIRILHGLIALEEDLVCQECNGLGKIISQDGRADLCESCYGLGYVRGIYSPEPLSPSKIRLRRALAGTFGGLGVFYAIFLYALIKYSLGPIVTLAVLLAGHLAAVTFLVLYIMYRAMHDT